jgi:hypothetical protein
MVESKKFASEISLFSMREGLNTLGKLKTRLEEMERVVNTLELDQDALLALNDFRKALPSVLKLQQPINTLSKKVQNALTKNKKLTKTLEELKGNMKDFHTRVYNNLFNEENTRVKRMREIMSEVQGATGNVEDMQTKLEGSIREVEFDVMEELKKLHNDFLKEAEKTKDEIMRKLFESDKELQKKKLKVKEVPVEKPEEDLSPVSVNKMVNNEVSNCISQLLEDFSDSLPIPINNLLHTEEYKSLELILIEENNKQETIRNNIKDIEKDLQSLIHNHSKENIGGVTWDSLKSKVDEVKNEVTVNAKLRNDALELCESTTEKAINNLKEMDTYFLNKLSNLQKRINAYSSL